MKGRDLSQPTPYEIHSLFSENEVIDHKVFGVGLVTRVATDDKIEVVFSKGKKVLAHDR